MPDDDNPTVEKFSRLIGPAQFIVEIGCRHAPDFAEALQPCSVLVFEPRHLETKPRGVKVIPAGIGQRTADNTRSLDFYWDEYRKPIDLLLCNEPDYARVILGGNKTIFETRYAAFVAGEEGDVGMLAMLPDFAQLAPIESYAVFHNNAFDL